LENKIPHKEKAAPIGRLCSEIFRFSDALLLLRTDGATIPSSLKKLRPSWDLVRRFVQRQMAQ